MIHIIFLRNSIYFNDPIDSSREEIGYIFDFHPLILMKK